MKKILLIVLALSVGFSAFAQRATVPVQLRDKAVRTEYQKPARDLPEFTVSGNPTVKSYPDFPDETQLGTTWYDLWSNNVYGNRYHQFSDGTRAATWIFSAEAAFTDRGTGYNYYDGNAWGPQPAARIENVRTGWGSITSWGENGEIVIAHNANNLELSRRETKGTGAWTEFNYAGLTKPTWPKVVCSGENNQYVHVMYSSYDQAYNGQATALFYGRTTDGGDTWDPANIVLDGMGPDYYLEFQSEEYILASRGDIVAILVADAWADMFLMKSYDNGENWEKIMIWEHPYPFFDWLGTITTTFFTVGNAASMALDADGKAHVAFAINRVIHDSLAASYNYYPFVDGIGYWNEDMLPFSNDTNALSPYPPEDYPGTEMVENVNLIGWTQDVNGNDSIEFPLYINAAGGIIKFPVSYREIGLSSWPTITVDDNGNIFVAYASLTETYTNEPLPNPNNYRKIWARAYAPGAGWGPFYHVTEKIDHIFDESIYPLMMDASSDEVHLIYQADVSPGLALHTPPDHPAQENRIIEATIQKSDLLTGIKGNEIITNASVSQNYPNPFSNTSTVTVNLQKTAKLSLEVTNMIGQSIMTKNRGTVKPGTYFFQIDATNLQNGIYFYTVKANNSAVTKKMIVQ